MLSAASKAREVCLAALLAAKDDYDTEAAHKAADDALCEFLRAIGRDDIVDVYEDIGKWYA